MRYDCLIVDDEAPLAETTSEYFNMFDVKSAYVQSYNECIEFFDKNEASLILLDINLGNASGFDLCKRLREKTQIPILFVSARSSDDDILIALNIGGDDYIQKPFTLSVLLAKVKAVLKRYNSGSVHLSKACGDIIIDHNLCRVCVKGAEIKLKAMEYKLLSYFMDNRNRIISKEELFRNVWKDTVTGDGTLNVHIRHLREKIEADPNEPLYIKTVWGVGYIFEEGNL
ncbi:MAG TPA: response regulator transcription factor [Ruminiclostridium sp.]|nr:response regulator transcription factor [Ruminiclostridium sp.]